MADGPQTIAGGPRRDVGRLHRRGIGRRRLLAGTGAALATGLAGCGGSSEPTTTTSIGLEDYRTEVSVPGLEVFVSSYGGSYGAMSGNVEIEGGFFYYPPERDSPVRIRVNQFAIEFYDDAGSKQEEVTASNGGQGWKLVPDEADGKASEVEWTVRLSASATYRTFVVRVEAEDVEAL